MKCNDVTYKEYCKDCPYLFERNEIWWCDLKKETKCEDKFIDCMIAEEEQEESEV